MKNKTKIKLILVLFIGFLLGMLDHTEGFAEAGFKKMVTPFWGITKEIHWWWDLWFGLTIVSLAILIWMSEEK
jgi:hypothetical protein